MRGARRLALAVTSPIDSKDIAMRRHVLLLLAVCALATPAFAQFETANVVGTVRDSSGGVVSDAKVTLTNTQTGVSVERTSGRQRQLRVLHGPHRHLCRDRGEGGLLGRARREPAGHRRRPAARRSDDGGRPALGEGRGQRQRGAAADRFERSQPGDHRRADPGAAAERPRVFGVGAAVARRPPCRRSPPAAAKARSTSTACARPSTTS